MGIVGARARLLVEARDGLEVVIHHVRRRRAKSVESARKAASEIGDQHLDTHRRRMTTHGTDTVDEMLRAAVAQVVAVDAGDHDIAKLQSGNGLSQVQRLFGIERQRTSMSDVAERTAARAKLAHDHEGRRTFAEALADVRAGCFFANGMQIVLPQDALDVVKAGRGWCSRAYPRGLWQPLRDHDFYGNSRSLGAALVFDPGGCGREGARLLRRGSDIAHRLLRSMAAIAWLTLLIRRSSISVREARTPRSRSCVTASPG